MVDVPVSYFVSARRTVAVPMGAAAAVLVRRRFRLVWVLQRVMIPLLVGLMVAGLAGLALTLVDGDRQVLGGVFNDIALGLVVTQFILVVLISRNAAPRVSGGVLVFPAADAGVAADAVRLNPAGLVRVD